MNQRNSRQSFLGPKLPEVQEQLKVGIVGVGGGGSFISTQLAHIGFINVVAVDPDVFEESNTNRLIGIRETDIPGVTPKVDICERNYRDISRTPVNFKSYAKKWQECIDEPEFQSLNLIFACLDDFSNRMQLESYCRSKGIILIDIGMTIKMDLAGQFQMMGQVVLSHPDGPCFKCYNFITDEMLALESDRYGDAGVNPQVVWANGILSSTAVGLGMELSTGWVKNPRTAFFKRFDGNVLELKDDHKIKLGHFRNGFVCSHYCTTVKKVV